MTEYEKNKTNNKIKENKSQNKIKIKILKKLKAKNN